MKIRDKVNVYLNFKVEIAKIIGYTDLYETITPLLHTKWAMKDGLINFDRLKEGDMWDYFTLIISSLGMKNEIFFMGEEDGLHFIMAYPEDDMWNETEIYIFDNKNRVEWKDDF